MQKISKWLLIPIFIFSLTLFFSISNSETAAQTITINRFGDEVRMQPDTSMSIRSFSATLNSGTVYLKWNVKGQKKNGIYLVQRSADNITFNVIGLTKGIGSPLEVELMYSFRDAEPLAGASYYTLLHVTNDNTFFETNSVALIPISGSPVKALTQKEN